MDRQQIEEAFGQSRYTILGLTESPRMMFHLDFTDFPTPGGCQDGNEPMTFAVQGDLFQDRSTVRFESAVVVVEINVCQPTDQPVKNSTRQNLVPRIVTN